jgi:hypothetical protein
MTARLTVRVDRSTVALTTSVAYARRPARALWSVVAPIHRRVVPYLLRRAVRDGGAETWHT